MSEYLFIVCFLKINIDRIDEEHLGQRVSLPVLADQKWS